MVAIPVTGDQPINAKAVEKMGFGLVQPYQSLNEADLYKALDAVLHQPQYLEKAQKYGSILNDQINRPLDRAIWWIEHVMRHPKMYQGRSPVHKLAWFQYFLLDVLAIYAVILYVIYKILYFLFCVMCCKRQVIKLKTE